MKTPTWAIVIGICLMLFGGCSLTKNARYISMPSMLEMQQNMMSKMAEVIPEEDLATTDNDAEQDSLSSSKKHKNKEAFNKMSEEMQKMFHMSEYTKTWTVRFGYIGLLVSIIYILSGVFLMIRRDFSIKLVYAALIASILFSLIQSIALASDTSGGFIALASGFSNIFGIVVDVILLVIVAAMDKSAFKNLKV